MTDVAAIVRFYIDCLAIVGVVTIGRWWSARRQANRLRSPTHVIDLPRALAVATRLAVKRWGKERKAQALIPRVNRRG